MIIFKATTDIRAYLENQQAEGVKIGFIPTMGALHAGHISLVKTARDKGLRTVCSIFLNPTQFNDPKDYEKYPVTTDADIELLLLAGCDVLFLPSVAEVYPNGPEYVRAYDFGYLDTILEGATRPGHFKGVGQVVGRLLEMIQPDSLFLGQKDYQQCMAITALRDLMHLNQLNVVICPTVREDDGLAMSSRNRRLNDGQRVLAGVIYQCLVSIVAKKEVASFVVVQRECLDLLRQKGFEPEYVAIAEEGTLRILDEYEVNVRMVALIAAKIGGVRLIDNMLF